MVAFMRMFVLLALLICMRLPVGASEICSPSDFDADSILRSLPDAVREALPEEIFQTEGFAERFDAAYFFDLIERAIESAFSPALRMCAVMLGVVLTAASLHAAKGLFASESMSTLFEFVSGLCILLTAYENLRGLFLLAEAYLTQLSGIVTAMVPVMLAIGTAGGNLTSSMISGNGMMLGLAFVEMLAAHGLFPMLRLCFGITAASGIGGGLQLGGISKTVRNIFTWILGFAAAVISAVMHFQTVITARADSLSMRAAKFAASQAVPVVGGIASDAVGTVAESLSLVRSTVGAVGVIIILVLTLPILVQILLVKFGVGVSETAAEMLGLTREKNLLSELCGLIGYLAAVCVIAALMFVYALTLFAKTSAALGS